MIDDHIRRLMGVMGMDDVQLNCELKEPGVLRVSIMAGPSGNMLIGVQGANLNALQHIIRCVLRKHIAEDVYITVDVNGYRVRRERTLLEFAQEVARRAQKTGKQVTLSPMNAVDRRIIHSALAGHKDVLTESVGDGTQRRVVVRPVFL
jgi:spoIIIJ-associated protein